MPFRREDNGFHRQVEALSLPQSNVTLRNIRSVKQNARRLKPAMFVKHLRTTVRVVTTLVARPQAVRQSFAYQVL